MKTLIVYNSIYRGNTEKIARVMGEELNADLVKSSEMKNFDVSKYDLVGLGSGIYGGKHHASIIELVNKLGNIKNKRFFIFSTSASGEDSLEKNNNLLKEKISSKAGRVLGAFNCIGYAALGPFKMNRQRPNEEDLEKAKEFVRGLAAKPLTLCLLVNNGKVLLGMKKRGFGEGRWNGFGGKLEKGETVIDAAKRELFEEAMIRGEELDEVGVIDFDYIDTGKLLEVHIFLVSKYNGEPVETEEMKPQWFHLDEMPFDDMWPDDSHWFPLFLQKKKFRGKFLFENNDKIIDYTLDIID